MFEAVLFDFDGTLVDFVGSDVQSHRWLHAHASLTIPFDDFLETSVDEVMRFHRLVEEGKVDPLSMHEFRLKNTFARHKLDWDAEYVDLYRHQLFETCLPFTGVEKLLSGAKQKAKTGLITNAYDGDEQRERVRRAGLAACFDVIVVAGDLGVYKPDPAIFWHTLDRIDVEPHNALYVGDSVTHDIRGAKSAGMKTVLWSQRSNREATGADYVVKDVDELQVLLDRVMIDRRLQKSHESPG